ncbi:MULTISPECIES: DNA cytosine methyltransferase [unclassified Paraburkholderia]|uniref:DNA cytosine methyltransferase n=1 Tax=unclassified Paraburkholderia TaxID=2615204 RepID=UPI00161FF3AE|nr:MULTISPECIES: DNA cytosine methyltransferase [unclassified Paraburkholderia]MBB5443273.1 DNA (cytosine-5)-methyltransferase 1 [Paraburkholderia sp. WSM4177]MBB5483121.1 DNA (cytosine-5)-methyltransferase 1 [Paraburkholderia sp. WSM4180]
MRRDTFTIALDLGAELIVDNFAGGGGASTGIERAFGRPVDIAINHDGEALAMHAANHPQTAHYTEDVFAVHPGFITRQQPIGLAWFSPDCKHHSKAKGGKPREQKIRGLAWVTLKWAVLQSPRGIGLENVEEFQDWGPLDDDGRPIKAEKGRTFRAFVSALSTGLAEGHPDEQEIFETLGADFPLARLRAGLGYRVEWRVLRACDFGAPTIRKRLYLFARRDGLPIVWPTATHGDPKSDAVRAGKLAPWRTAAECIDWSIPCPSIFERKRPLKDATLRRIARGIMKFVVNSPAPFIVSTAHSTTTGRGPNVWGIDEPLRTVTSSNDKYVVAPTLMHVTHQGGDRAAHVDMPLATVTGAHRGEQALIGATLIQMGYGEREGQAPRVPGLDKPLGTVVAGGGKHALVAAFLAKHFTGVTGTRIDVPAGTVTTSDHHSLVTAQLVGCGGRAGQSRPRDVSEPAATITAKADTALAVSHLVKLRNNQFGQDVRDPAPTITAGGGHIGEVRAFLIAYYGNEKDGVDLRDPMRTVPTHDRFGLVTVNGEDYVIADIGMRMLTPRELARAQGFPDSYVLDPVTNGKPLSKSAQVRMIGNSVCPDVAAALIEANFEHERALQQASA